MGRRVAHKRGRPAGQFALEPLEPRLLLSADPAPLVLPPSLTAEVSLPLIARVFHTDPAQVASADAAASPRKELVFIDPSISESEQLVRALSPDATGRQLTVVLLDPTRDGIAQVTETLARQAEKPDAVHFITHGIDGGIKLGATWVDKSVVDSEADQIAAWSRSLAPGADLLFYGCNVAASAAGRGLVDAIASLSGVDAAASVDSTGNAALSGNWELEYATGPIDVQAPLSLAGQQSWSHLLATATVTTAADLVDGDTSSIGNLIASQGVDGKISLREAMIAANNTPGLDTIDFAIGAGAQTIQPTSALPTVTDAVVIDATTQPGYAGAPVIVLDGSLAGVSDGLRITAGNSVVRGLVINRFGSNGIALLTAGGNVVEGNYIGTNAAGTAAAANGNDGIYIDSPNNVVGGTTAAQRNVVSGNLYVGIEILGSGAAGNQILGNYIGLNAAGTAAVPNQNDGIDVANGASNTTIGGAAAGAGNVISGNNFPTMDGIWLDQSTGTVIQGNKIGTNAAGTAAIPNGRAGVYVLVSSDNSIGGTGAGEGNTIANSGTSGVVVSSNTSQRNAILGNRIFGNSSLGIDLREDGVTANDGNSPANRANKGMDFPVFTTAAIDGATLQVAGYVGSAPGQSTFAGARVEVFKSDLDASGFGEGSTYLGFLTADASGNFSGTLTVAGLAVGDKITGTATDGATNTSEFSANASVVQANLPPTVGVPGAQALDEDTSLVFSNTGGNAITVGDPDAGASPVQVTVSVAHGTLTLNDRLGGELQVNTTTADNQQAPRVAVAPDGHYVVVWQSKDQDGDKFGIFARVFNADGTAQTGEIALNTTTLDDQTAPVVAIDATGRFVVAWQSKDINNGWDIQARTFNANGTALSAEKRINNTAGDDQTAPAVAMDAAGNIVIAWQSKGQDNGDGKEGIYFRRYTVTLNNVGNETRANSTTLDSQTAPAVARDSAGRFIIVWQSKLEDGSGFGIYGQLYAANGSKNGGDFQINTTIAGDQTAPAVAVNRSTGDFVVAWQSKGQDNPGENKSGIYAQRYNAAGTAQGGELLVNTTVGDDQTDPTVAMQDDGAFAVLWTSAHQDADGSAGVYGQKFSGSGARVGPEFLVNTTTAGGQSAPAVAMPGNGQMVAVWQSQNQDGDGNGVFGQRFVRLGAVTFSAGDGIADATTTFTGAMDDINIVLDGLRYVPTGNYAGPDTLSIAVNDLGNTGGGGPQTGNGTVGLTVNPVNDAPVLDTSGAPAFTTITEDSVNSSGNLVSTLLGTSVTEVDAGALQGIAVTATTTGRGTWQYSTDGGASWTPVGAVSNSAALLLRATDRLRLVPDTIDADTGSVSYRAWDQTSGAAGAKVDTSVNGDITAFSTAVETAAITVTAVNDGPIVTAPATETVVEETTLVFSSANGNSISIADVDVASGQVEVTLSVTNGTLRLNGTNGLTFTVGDGVDDAAMTFRGTLANVNARLNGLRYDPTPDFDGASALTVTANDLGNSGSGSALTDSRTVAITVSPVDDGPTLTVPVNQTIAEDTSLTFSGANGTGIVVGDIDARTSPIQLSLSVAHGTLTLASTAGLSVVSGADGSAGMVVRGTTGALATALDGLRYTPDADFFGADVLGVAVDDLGNTGSGGPLSVSDTVGITITSVNDAPVDLLPAPQTVGEDSSLVLSVANGNALSVVDVDADNDNIQVTLSSTHGTLTLAGTGGLNFTTGDGTADAAMVFQGRQTNINAALNGLRFTPTAGYAGPAALQIASNDLGHNGAGGTLLDSDVLDITVTPDATNDAPTLQLPGPQVTVEETPLVFTGGNLISLNDDAGGNPLQVTLSVTGGTLNLSVTSGQEFQISTAVSSDQQLARVAMAPDGTFIAVWQSNGQDGNSQGIFAQRYDGDGFPLDAEFRVNTTTANAQTAPRVTVAADGTFVVVWQSQSQDGGGGGGTGVYGQRFDATGHAIGAEFRANTQVANEQTAPAVATDAAGNFVVVWQSEGQDGSGPGVYGQRFNAGGVAQGGEFRVNTTTAGAQQSPDVAMAAAGGFVVTWQSPGDGNGSAIYARRYDATGTAVTGEFLVNTITFKNQQSPSIAMDDAGDFVIAWQSEDLDYNDGKYGIYAQRYTSAGATVGPQFLVNTTTPRQQTLPSVAMDGSGNFVIAWQAERQDNQDHNRGIFARRYDAAGGAIGGEFAVNTTTAKGQTSPSVGFADDGQFVVAWTSEDQDGSGLGVFGQRFRDTRRLTFGAGDGVDDATMTFTGTQDQINDALDGLTFTPATNFDGVATLSVAVDDLGHSGAGGARTASGTVKITVQPVNDAPHVALPATQTITEDTTLIFSVAGGNAIVVTDADAGTGAVTVTLATSQGRLTLAGTAGLTFTSGDGTSDASMTFSGTLAAINAALDGLRFAAPTSFTGPATLSVSANDGGNTGMGGALSDAASTSIVVASDAVNEAPTVGIPGPQRTAVSTPLVLSTAGSNALSVVDDAGTATVQVTLTVTRGVVTLSNTVGPQTLVNTYATQDQDSVQIAAIPGGGHIAVWRSNGQDGSGGGIYAQRFDALGLPVGSEFRVNTTTGGNQSAPAVAINASGQFVVAWVSDNQDGSGKGVYLQRFDATGQRAGAEVLVNTTIAGDQIAPAVAIDATGAFAVAWQSSDSSGQGIFAQRFDANGQPAGDEVQVNTTTANDQSGPVAAMSAAGTLIVVWQGNDANGTGILGQRYDATGAALGGEFVVNKTTAGSQVTPAVAMDGSGKFAVAWAGPDANGTGIFARRYNSSGVALGNDIAVNTTTAGGQTLPDIALSDSGQLVVMWQGSDANNAGIFAQTLDASGAKTGGELAVNTITAGNQTAPSVAMFGDGTFVGAWTSDNVDSNGTGIAAQRFRKGDELTFSTGDGVADSSITFTGTLPNVNAALDGLLFSPQAGFTGLGSIQLGVNDLGHTGAGGALTGQATLDIVIGNAPLLDLDANDSSGVLGANYRANFRPGLGPVLIADSDASLTDPNSGLTSLTVQITNRRDGNSEVLSASVAGTSIVASYNNGKLTLTGNDSAAHYQQVLRTVRYDDTAPSPDTTPRTITFVATDSSGSSNVATTTVEFVTTNNAPVATADTYVVAEDGTLVSTTGVLANDTDADGDALTAALVAGPAHGMLSLGADGSFTYTPNANYAGSDSFTYRASDGIGLSPVTTVAITVNSVNDAPAGTDRTVTTPEDTVYTFARADFGFTDPADAAGPGANAFTAVVITTLPGAGTLTDNGVAVTAGQSVSVTDIDAGRLVFTPSPNASGAGYASFTFQVQDTGGTALGGVDLDPTPNTLTVDVTAVNDAPVNTVPGAQSTSQNTSVVFAAANGNALAVSDVDVAAATLRVTLSVTNGTLTLGATTGLAFTTGDGSADATMTFTGTPADINTALDGLQFDPALNFSGAAVLTIATNDLGNTGAGGPRSATNTVQINVAFVNTAPTLTGATDLAAIDEDQTSTQGTAVTALIAGHVTDPDAGALSGIAVTAVDSTHGSWEYSMNAGASWAAFGSPSTTSARLLAADANTFVRFVPGADFQGTVTGGLTFVAWDQSAGAAGGTADVTVRGGATAFSAASASAGIAVNSVNDAPEGGDSRISTLENTAYTFTVTDFGFGDSHDSPADALLAVEITTLPAAGSLTNNGVAVVAGTRVSAVDIAAGHLVFTPAVDASGAGYAGFSFRVQDDGGTAGGGVDLALVPSTITIDVTSVNSAPSGAGTLVTTREDIPYAFTAADFGFTDAGDSPGDHFAAVVITTLPGTGTLTANGLAVTAGQRVNVGDIDAGRLLFIPALDASGSPYASFTFQVQDDGGTAGGGTDLDATPNTLTVAVLPLNDAPVGADAAVTTVEGSSYTFATTDFAFSDPGDTPANTFVAVTITTVPGAGTLALNGVAVAAGQRVDLADIAAGKLVFTPARDGAGAGYGNFTFQVQDDGGTALGGADLDVTPRTMTVNVTPVNDAPSGADTTVITLEDTAHTFTTADFGFTDPADSPANNLAAVTITGLSGSGTLTLGGVAVTVGERVSAADIAAGRLVFTPEADASGAGYASFAFRVQDDGGTALGGVDTDPTRKLLTVTVLAVNDAPVATVPGPQSAEHDTPVIFAAALGNGIAVDDVDAGRQPVIVTLQGFNGTLTLGGTSGLIFSAGDGTDDAAMTFTGTVADVNAALTGLAFLPTPGHAGAAALQLTVNDGGNTGRGGPQATTQVVSITVRPGAVVPGAVDPIVQVPDPTFVTPAVETPPAPQTPSAPAPGPALEPPPSPPATAFVPTSPAPPPGVPESREAPPESPAPVESTDTRTDTTATAVDAGRPAVPSVEATRSATPVLSPAVAVATPVAPAAPIAIAPALAPIVASRVPTTTTTSAGTTTVAAARADASGVPLPAAAQGEAGAIAPADPVALQALQQTLHESDLPAQLTRMREEVTQQTRMERHVIGSTVAVTTGLSVGYVVWLLRGGLLLGGLLSSLPAWQFIDPWPVLTRVTRPGEDKDADPSDDPVERMFDRAKTLVARIRKKTPRGGPPDGTAAGGDA